MDYSFLKNKNIAVLGMGVEGIALTNFLFDKVSNITVLDIKTEDQISDFLNGEEKESFVKIVENEKIKKTFGDNYLENLAQYDIVFRSPGISAFDPKILEAKKAGVEISSQIKLFFDLCPCKIIGVTGTKGKGTTSSLIFQILERNYKSQETNNKTKVYLAGNIGYPAITLLPELRSDDYVILELSSFQLMDLEKSPHIAVITNLLIDHLNYHKDEEEYRSSKLNIIAHQSANDLAIINLKAEREFELGKKTKAKVLLFANEENDEAKAYIKKEGDDSSLFFNDGKNEIFICRKNQIHLLGDHNLENIAAATLVCDVIGVDPETIKETIKEFKGLPHRLEFIEEINGIQFINDSFATNPEPTLAAIRAIPDNKILILGGSSKGADFTEMTEEIAKSKVSGIILIGDEEDKIEKSLLKNEYKGKIVKGAKTMKEIIDQALTLAKSNDSVLLSPACASFGLFKDYKDRGNQFREEVLKLKS